MSCCKCQKVEPISWEYMAQEAPEIAGTEDLVSWLDSFGCEGWELCHGDGEFGVLIFKRPRIPLPTS